MENLDITFHDILNEYNKYILSSLIDKPYDFNQLRSIVKEYSKKYNFFDYSDDKTDAEIAKDISMKLKELNG